MKILLGLKNIFERLARASATAFLKQIYSALLAAWAKGYVHKEQETLLGTGAG
jgi:hypothetical protein